MANISVREAVKHYSVSRPTLTKHLNSGKISGVKNGKGQWEISPAELARVYTPRQTDVGKEQEELATVNSSVNSSLQAEVEALRTQLAVAEALAEDRQRTLDQVVQQLTDQTATKRKTWWPFR